MGEYVLGKSKYRSIDMNMQFHQFQADFNSKIFKKVQATIDRKLIDAGLALVSQKSLEIPI